MNKNIFFNKTGTEFLVIDVQWLLTKMKFLNNVQGYTIRQIEDALSNSDDWDEWRDNIKLQGYNPTKNHVNNAFKFWNSTISFSYDPVSPISTPTPIAPPTQTQSYPIDREFGEFCYPEQGTNRRVCL